MLPFTKTLSPRLSDSPIRLCRNNSQEQCCLPQKTRSKPILTKTRNICFLCQWSKNQHKLTALSLCLGLVFHFLQTLSAEPETSRGGHKRVEVRSSSGFSSDPQGSHAAHTCRGDILPLPEQENPGHKQKSFCIHHSGAITVGPPHHCHTDGHNLWFIL